MQLGAFSISLVVKELHASRAFYEKLGFEAFHGDRHADRQVGVPALRADGGGDQDCGELKKPSLLWRHPGWEVQPERSSDQVDAGALVERATTSPVLALLA